ncbi:hypothetical protein SERLA73DRAFT_149599 [Serpula lacrymans var. lacrymans S7.3]|uniref:Uncharacterized protein n=2 Tax=Serpula lacrymans var. lacrymans TaxID=341189 RepID=F8PJK0_SERL3|nr:hypothetical protein SERLA73DRAFT_149599 [Serpula lacrymans var. lacrymans S7.3]
MVQWYRVLVMVLIVSQLLLRIFNNKDKKKGQHDTYCWYMENIGLVASQFPDTSNVRFQSHIKAVEVVLMDHQAILKFLEFVRDKKDHWKLNHMELNLYKALHCSKTMTEVVAIVWFGGQAQSLSMCWTWDHYTELKQHLKLMITNPELIFGANVAPKTACFGGRLCFNPAAMAAAFKLASKLEHLCPITLALFQGALNKWESFTTEYAPGGTIDQASTEEHDAAWMPAINDANKGALGIFRLRAQDKPTLSMHQHNAITQFCHNDTQLFVDATFTSEDFCHAMHLVREIDSTGLEKKCHLEIIQHEEGEVQAKRQRVAEAAEGSTEEGEPRG